MALRNRVSAIDELAMATERLRVRDPREPKPSPPVLHIIEPHEVMCTETTEGTAHRRHTNSAFTEERVRAAVSSTSMYLITLSA